MDSTRPIVHIETDRALANPSFDWSGFGTPRWRMSPCTEEITA